MNDLSSKQDEILRFWFGSNENNVLANQKKWFMKDSAFDSEITALFRDDIELAKKGKYEILKQNAPGALAYIILLDQFSRNIFRDNALAFQQDRLALSACMQAIDKNLPEKLHPIKTWFMLLPLMHSEELEVQNLSLKKYEELKNRAKKEFKDKDDYSMGIKNSLDQACYFAEQHYKIIERFSRFPHRNKILERDSTAEELAFLENPQNHF